MAGFVRRILFRTFQFPKEAYGRLPARSSAVYCSANDACRQSLSPEEARKLDARLAKVRDAYFRRLPESDPEYDEMQDLLKKAEQLAANATYAPGGAQRTTTGGTPSGRGTRKSPRDSTAVQTTGFGLCRCDGARGDAARRTTVAVVNRIREASALLGWPCRVRIESGRVVR